MLTLLAYEPLTEQGLYSRKFIDDLTKNHEKYTHIIDAVGGYDNAAFSLKGNEFYLRDWFNNGLMRRVVLYNPEGLISWEGFINKLTYTKGSWQETKTMNELINRVYFNYTALDTSKDPPVPFPPATIIIDNPTSQATWGIKSVYQRGGELTDEEANAWAQAILVDNPDPVRGESINTTGSAKAELRVECLGYFHTLKWQPYITTDPSLGVVLSHQFIIEILQYFNTINPGWISQNFGWIDYNFRSQRRSSDGSKSCWDEIKDAIKLGGLGGERWVGGIYQDRQMIYKAAEEFTTLYSDKSPLIRKGDNRIFDQELDVEIKPWDMVPDRILKDVETI